MSDVEGQVHTMIHRAEAWAAEQRRREAVKLIAHVERREAEAAALPHRSRAERRRDQRAAARFMRKAKRVR